MALHDMRLRAVAEGMQSLRQMDNELKKLKATSASLATETKKTATATGTFGNAATKAVGQTKNLATEQKKAADATRALATRNKELKSQMGGVVAFGTRQQQMMTAIEQQTEKATEKTKKFGQGLSFLRGGLKNMIVTGMFMSIGWQAINTVLTTVTSAIGRLGQVAMELQTSMISLRVVTAATGRSFSDTLAVIEKHIDGLADRITLTKGVVRMLSTSLTTEQLDKFIQAIKDGAAAMGEDFSVQMERQALGLKRLEPRIADNIGAEIKLNIEYARAAKLMDRTVMSLTTLDRQQIYYNAIIRETSYFQGLHNELLDTAVGKMQKIGVEWTKLGEAMADTGPIELVMDTIGGLIETTKDSIEFNKRFAKSFDEPYQKIIEYIAILGRMDQLLSQLGLKQPMLERFEKEDEATTRLNKAREDMMMVIIQSTTKYQELDAAVKDATDREAEHGERLGEVEELLKSKNRLMGLISTFVMPDYRKELREITDALQPLIDQQRALERQMTETERILERKKMVLFPEEYLETEDKLKNVRQDLQSLQKEYERLHERLPKARTVTEYNETIEEAVRVEAEIAKKREEEANITEILTGEVETLEQKMATQQGSYAKLGVEIGKLERKKKDLQDAMQDTQDQMTELRKETWLLTEEQKFLKDALEEAKYDFELATTALNTYTSSMLRAKEAYKDLVDYMLTHPLPSGGMVTTTPPGVSARPLTSTAAERLGAFNITEETQTRIENITRNLERDWKKIFRGQFGIPFVPKTGLYMLHRGEAVTQSKTYQNDISVRIGTVVSGSPNEQKLFRGLQEAVAKGVSQ